MEQTTISFNPKPTPGELFSYDSQNYRLYSRLLKGPVTSREIIEDMQIFKYTSRISDVRGSLKPHLIIVEAKRIESSLFEYRLKEATT